MTYWEGGGLAESRHLLLRSLRHPQVDVRFVVESPLPGEELAVVLKEANLPEGVLVGAIVRNDEVLFPRGSTVINSNDRVVLFAATEAVKQVEQLFSVGLEFF